MLGEQYLRHFVDALVGALGGKDYRDQQFVGRVVFKRGAGVGVEPRKLRKNFFVSVHIRILSRTGGNYKRLKALDGYFSAARVYAHIAVKGGVAYPRYYALCPRRRVNRYS